LSKRLDKGDGRKRKKGKEVGNAKKEKRLKGEKRFGGASGFKFGGSKKGFGGKAGKDHEGEVEEMWDSIAGGNSEVYCLAFSILPLRFSLIDWAEII